MACQITPSRRPRPALVSAGNAASVVGVFGGEAQIPFAVAVSMREARHFMNERAGGAAGVDTRGGFRRNL